LLLRDYLSNVTVLQGQKSSDPRGQQKLRKPNPRSKKAKPYHVVIFDACQIHHPCALEAMHNCCALLRHAKAIASTAQIIPQSSSFRFETGDQGQARLPSLEEIPSIPRMGLASGQGLMLDV
jgi:hypothetical protein